MSTPDAPADRYQLWALMELAGSPEAVLDAERHLANLFGRRPSLFELVAELMERRNPALECAPRCAPEMAVVG